MVAKETVVVCCFFRFSTTSAMDLGSIHLRGFDKSFGAVIVKLHNFVFVVDLLHNLLYNKFITNPQVHNKYIAYVYFTTKVDIKQL